jgi:hypothetical protein
VPKGRCRRACRGVGDATFSDAGVGAVLAGHDSASGGGGDDFARIIHPAEGTDVGEADGLLRGVEDGGNGVDKLDGDGGGVGVRGGVQLAGDSVGQLQEQSLGVLSPSSRDPDVHRKHTSHEVSSKLYLWTYARTRLKT